MNALTRWNPFQEMQELEDGMPGFFGLRPGRRLNGGEDSAIGEWAPSVDITEDAKEWTVKADLPEVKKEDVQVTVEDGVLRMAGERKQEKEEKGKRYQRVEWSYGSFVRSFVLPDGADAAKASAEFKDGVLKVRLPKNDQARRKAIEVKVG